MKLTPCLTLLLLLAYTGCQTAENDNVTGSINLPKINIEPLPQWVTAESPESPQNGRQIRIETKFIEVEYTPSEDAEQPAIYLKNVAADESLKKLQMQESSDILSAPTVTALEDQLANIKITQELRYPRLSDGNIVFNSVDVGVSCHLKVTAGDDPETLNLQLLADVSQLEGFQEIMEGKFQVPVFSKRRIDTQLTLKSGQTALVGGLVTDKKLDIVDKLPLLGDIPVLGELFQRTGTESTKRELIVMVTPTIIESTGGSN